VWKELKDVGFSSATFPCSSDILKKMSLLQCCIHEAIRLHSPGILLRKAVDNFQLREFQIKKGDEICISAFLTHRNPKVYSNPLKFWPERFSAAIEEHKRYRHSYIPFGAGTFR